MYLTLNTHNGLYQKNHLPFDITSSPAKQFIIHDMIIMWTDDEEHLHNVLKWLKEYKVKTSKCEFLDRITYWKHEISILSLQKSTDKKTGYLRSSLADNVQQLLFFLGMVNDYHWFLLNVAIGLNPLHQLLQNEHKWCWSPQCKNVFLYTMELATSN